MAAFSVLHAAPAATTENTMSRKSTALFLSAALALACTGLAAPAAQAAPQVSVGVGIGVAPPAPRFERAPPPRAGYAWAPGYWQWSPRMRRHVWVAGRWMRVHPGYRYVPARWRQGPHGHWHFNAGHWAR